MKTLAILLMIMGVLLLFGVGLMGLIAFAMSFDAPGSADNPANWIWSLSMLFGPIFFILVILIFAWKAFRKGMYTRSVLISSIYGVAIIGGMFFLFASSMFARTNLQTTIFHDEANEKMYPRQIFLRSAAGGTDTIIVFPSGIVAYRLYTGAQNSFGGPVGDLNNTRDTIIMDLDTDTKINREDLSQFVNREGGKLTDVYGVK